RRGVRGVRVRGCRGAGTGEHRADRGDVPGASALTRSRALGVSTRCRARRFLPSSEAHRVAALQACRTAAPERKTMSIGGGIALFVIGAILAFAINVQVEWADLTMIGYILMGAGAVVFIIGLILLARRRQTTRRTTNSTDDPAGL